MVRTVAGGNVLASWRWEAWLEGLETNHEWSD